MAAKKNVKKYNKRKVKKNKIQAMADCRRHKAIQNKNNKSTDEISSSTPPLLSVLQNVDHDTSVTQDDDLSARLSNNESCLSESSTRPVVSTFNNVDHDASVTQDGDLGVRLSNNEECLSKSSTRLSRRRRRKRSKRNKSKDCQEKTYDASERLIIDKTYFFEKLKIISNHAPQFGCNLSNMNITGETKIGLISKLKLTCNMCNGNYFINTSDPEPTENLDVNTAAVSSISNAGIGLEQFLGLCSGINLPTLSQKIYDKKHNDICKHWTKISIETMEAAAERERLAAIEEGRVKDGIAVIDVIADACWSKRSYKCNYTALSGAAAIVGKKFGEILYLGVKNKYCCICDRAENKGIEPKEHSCYKNFTGPSSGMEAAILVEGFKNSVEMYKIIYGRVIADGDSSTYAKILEERPYKNVTVEKIECRNHILRNMCNKLSAVSKDTKYPIDMRKMLTTQRILAIRKVVCLAIKEHKNNNDELAVRINKLYTDISNAYNHAFGDHSACCSYYCSSEKKSENLVPKIKNSAFWSRIQYIIGIVATHSRSLIYDYDSNAVEQFNSIIAKFVGGKRTNLIQRQTYQSRCEAAVVSYNTKSALYNLQKSILGKSPKSKVKKFERSRIEKNKKRGIVKKVRKLNFNKNMCRKEDENYGTDTCRKPDMEKKIYEKAKQSFLQNLEKTTAERSQIERNTILQRNSSEWLELRRNLITASNFGKIIKRRPTTSASIVKSMLYKSEISNIPSIKHGVDNESSALDQLAAQENVQIRPCGLFIDSELPYLGATPDGIIDHDTIVEIKCPFSAFKMPLREAVQKRKIKFWEIKNNELVINKNDSWYYQIQGQLHITKRNMCLFAVWSGQNEKIVTEKIFRDDAFWEKKMVKKLTEFYMEHLLPELIDPRKSRNMELRAPVPKKRPITDPTEAGPSKVSHLVKYQKYQSGTDLTGPSNAAKIVLSLDNY